MGVGAAIAGAAVVGAGASIYSGSKAAKATKQAAQQSADVERYIYDTTREDYAPYREVGYGALGKLAGMYGVGSGKDGAIDPNADFYKSPDYNFRLNESIKALDRSASARGRLNSGATKAAVVARAGDLASSEYNNYANRLAALAGVGQSATGSTAQAGQQYAAGMSNAYQQAGNARASSYANTGAAINNTVGTLASAYLYNQGWGGSRNPPGAMS